MPPDQLTMFEPSGSELAMLAQKHINAFETFKRQADNLSERFFIVAARSFDFKAAESLASAQVCEMALQLETLAGLSA